MPTERESIFINKVLVQILEMAEEDETIEGSNLRWIRTTLNIMCESGLIDKPLAFVKE
ncbi:hypothetical protein LCGC14_0345800 [marine sediment metagenome]|uniref:Uncharacterized protein n=1 Tax=marine sediment metagenome TaxID=412755 RepID=A0A0F9WK22_9ZZZZ